MLVYALVNDRNQKAYIGQTKNHDLSKRWNPHLTNGKANSHLAAAIKKYKPWAFRRQILAQTVDHRELDLLERFWIAFYRSNDPRYGYNQDLGGRFGIDHHSEAVKRRIGESCRKAWQQKSAKEKAGHARKAGLIWNDNAKKEAMRKRVSERLRQVWEQRSESERRWGPHSIERKKAISEGLRRYWERKRMRRKINRTLQFVWDHKSEKDKQKILRNLEQGRKNASEKKQLPPKKPASRVLEMKPPLAEQKKAVASASLAVLKQMKRQVRHIQRTLDELHQEMKGSCLW
jgi:hypothetical protein